MSKFAKIKDKFYMFFFLTGVLLFIGGIIGMVYFFKYLQTTETFSFIFWTIFDSLFGVRFIIWTIESLLVLCAKEKKITCPKCGHKNEVDNPYCSKCGEPLKKQCPECSTLCRIDDDFCYKCGKDLKND